LATSAQIINLDNITRFDYPIMSSDRNFRAPDISGKTSQEAMISKEPTKFLVKISVTSRCNKYYQK